MERELLEIGRTAQDVHLRRTCRCVVLLDADQVWTAVAVPICHCEVPRAVGALQWGRSLENKLTEVCGTTEDVYLSAADPLFLDREQILVAIARATCREERPCAVS